MFDFMNVTEVRLAEGHHESAAAGMCFMEMVAWFAGEKHSDRPACACPVLGRYGIELNDTMPDAMRDRLLKPLVPMIAGTRGTSADELARARFLTMWNVNKIMPIYLRVYQLAPLDKLATACEQASSVDQLNDLAARAARADLADLAARAALAALADLADLAARAALAALADLADLADLAALAALADLADLAALAREQILELIVEGLRQAILIGPHESFGPTIDLTERHTALRDLVAA